MRGADLPVRGEQERGEGEVERESLTHTPPHDGLGLRVDKHSLQSQLQPAHMQHSQP